MSMAGPPPPALSTPVGGEASFPPEAIGVCVRALEQLVLHATREAGISLDASGTPLTPITESLTCFHSSCVPPVTVSQYCARIATYSGYGVAGIVAGLVMAARYSRATKTVPTLLTIHRLILASVLVGAKSNFDVFYNNAHLAKVGGVPLDEVNDLELDLLFALGFSVTVKREEVTALLTNIPSAVRDGQPVQAIAELFVAAAAPPVAFDALTSGPSAAAAAAASPATS